MKRILFIMLALLIMSNMALLSESPFMIWEQDPISPILNPDGTLNLNDADNRSFNTSGYYLTSEEGQPVFLPSDTHITDNKGQWKWDDRFDESGMGGAYPGVFSLAVMDGELYAGGRFTIAGGIEANCIAKWDGTSWSPLGTGMSGEGIGWPNVHSLAVMNGNLYAGGNFTIAGGENAKNIAMWDGTAWHPLGTGLDGTVFALAVMGCDLYAGGSFWKAGETEVNYIARWDGSTWHPLGSGMTYGWVHALAVMGDNLYAGGGFLTAGGVDTNRIARWDGATWHPVGSGLDNPAEVMTVMDGSLYVGGSFWTAGGTAASRIARWDGTAWSALGTGIIGNAVESLAVINGHLFAGGPFWTAGDIEANYIAQWDGTSWYPLESGTNDSVFALAALDDDLYAGGTFMAAGGKPSFYIGRWYKEKPKPTYPAIISLENPSVRGIWRWKHHAQKTACLNPDNADKASWTWTRLISGLDAKKILAADITGDEVLNVILHFNDNTLGYYNFSTGSWYSVISHCHDFAIVRTELNAPKKIVFSIDQGVFLFNYHEYSYYRLYSAPAELMLSADLLRDGLDDLIIAFMGIDNLYIYSFASSSHSVIARVKPSQMVTGDLTGDGYDELVCSFDGFGIYLFRNLSGDRTYKTSAFDLINDIPKNHQWFSNNKGWQVQRITYADPMPGHKMTTGNIAHGDAEELILALINRTYYYSYANSGWTTLTFAPMKTILAGQFTGGEKDDLITCLSWGNNIYLRSSSGVWQLMVNQGNTNAMSVLK